MNILENFSQDIQDQINNLHFEQVSSRMKDLTGQKFNHLTVLGLAGKQNNRAIWWVICDCPNHTIFSIRGDAIPKKDSCGCSKSPKLGTRNLDLIGKTFGRLTVLYQLEERAKNGNLLWHCQCECGNEIDIQTSSLTSGNTQSCGCLKKDHAHFTTQSKNLVGQTFGHLTVIEKTDKRQYGKIVWKCRCDCGNEVLLNTTRLTQGNDISCGCQKKSYGVLEIESILKEASISYIQEFCISELGNKRFDFALLNDNNQVYRFIEFDGEQHYRHSGGWNTEESVQKTQARDKEKNEYALSHNIPLVRIPYWERDNITLDMLLGDKYLITRGD